MQPARQSNGTGPTSGKMSLEQSSTASDTRPSGTWTNVHRVVSRSPTGGRNRPNMSSRSARTATLAALVVAITSASAQAATPSAYVYATSFDHVVRQYSADDGGMLS